MADRKVLILSSMVVDIALAVLFTAASNSQLRLQQLGTASFDIDNVPYLPIEVKHSYA